MQVEELPPQSDAATGLVVYTYRPDTGKLEARVPSAPNQETDKKKVSRFARLSRFLTEHKTIIGLIGAALTALSRNINDIIAFLRQLSFR
jgi:hypothetical protein